MMKDKELLAISETRSTEFVVFASKNPRQADRVYNTLSFSKRMALVLHARGVEREKLITMAKDAEVIVQSLPEEEFYYTLKEIGPKHVSSLVALASPEQILFCFDIEGWKRGRLNHRKMLDWWELVLDTGDTKAWQLIQDMEEELFVVFLAGQLKVVKPGTEIELAEIDRDWFTLDNQYFLKFRNPRQAGEIVSQILELIFRKDYQRYTGILEGVLWSVPTETEELAFKWRQSRLMNKGFPDLYESLEIYRYVDPSVSEDKGRTYRDPVDEGTHQWDEIDPNFYLVPKEGRDNFFSQSLRIALERDGADTLKGELVYLCNKAMVADGAEISELDDVRQTLDHVYHYLNVGLSHLAQEDTNQGATILQRLYLKQIFQVGYSRTVQLSRRAQRIVANEWFPEGKASLTLLDTPYREAVEGLLQKRPVFFQGLVDPSSADYRHFQTLHDVSVSEDCLGTIEFILHLHSTVYGFSYDKLRTSDLTGCSPPHWDDITFRTITLVGLTNYLLKGTLDFIPLNPEEVRAVIKQILQHNERGDIVPALRPGVVDQLQHYLHRLMEGDQPHDISRAWLYWQQCLEAFVDEFGLLDLNTPIDPRFVKGLLVCRE
jgi:hypothetical protein